MAEQLTPKQIEDDELDVEELEEVAGGNLDQNAEIIGDRPNNGCNNCPNTGCS